MNTVYYGPLKTVAAELLAACEAALSVAYDTDFGDFFNPAETINKLETAIAKARGGA